MSNIPQELKYTSDHEWVRIDGHNVVIGITDFAQSELGDIVFVDIDSDSVGDHIDEGSVFGTVEAVKTVSDLFMPLDVEITEINARLDDEPELVNRDPYGEGWMIKATLTDASQLEKLLSADQYKEVIH